METLRALWRYRHFIAASVRGELLARFARSRLGAAWYVLHPLVQTAIFALVLSEFLAMRLPGHADRGAFAVYLMAGMAAWGLFSEIVNRCLTVFIEYAAMMKKIAFPRLCLPLIVAGSALLHHGLLLVAVACACVALGHAPSLAWLAVPCAAALLAAMGFGLGILLGTLNVFMRDVGQVCAVALQLWFWLTPVVYPVDALPADLRGWIGLNPLAPMVAVYQRALLEGQAPQWSALWMPALLAAFLMLAAYVVFRRAGPEVVDAL